MASRIFENWKNLSGQIVVKWAEPVIKDLRKYNRNNAIWWAVTLIAIAITFAVFYLANPDPLSFNLLILTIYAIFLGSGLLSLALLKRPKLTPSGAYVVGLVEIIDAASRIPKAPIDEFHDVVADLLSRIDRDIRRYQSSLPASRTCRMLRRLRTCLLKFAWIVEEQSKGTDHLTERADLVGTIGQTATGFYRFDDIEGYVRAFTDATLRNVSKIPESSYVLSRRRVFMKYMKGWHRLPAPVNLAIFVIVVIVPVAIAPLAAWFPSMDMSSQIVIRVAISVGAITVISSLLKDSLLEWVRSTF